jgi:pimeloyl-ACP methyl ester carboxylesterase
MYRQSDWVLAFALLSFPSASWAAEDRFFDSNGVKIRYTVQGQGEPVLLIHGFTANIEKNWTPDLMKTLTKDFQVIALDNRGHGKSDKPHDPKKYGMEMVEDAVRLLDHLKIKKAHVVGYSMGAMITNKLMTTYPDRFITATLGGAAGIREGGDTKRFDAIAESLEQGKGFGPLFAALTPPGRPKPTEEQVQQMNSFLMMGNDPKALAAVARAFKDLAVAEDKLKANRIPTLALIGEIDPLKKGVDELKGHLANLKIVVIDGADHITAFSSPEFSRHLSAFLTQHRQVDKAK